MTCFNKPLVSNRVLLPPKVLQSNDGLLNGPLPDGLVDRTMRPKMPPPTCGKILGFCKGKVSSFREKIGIRICVFKLGVTADPITRYKFYTELGFTTMWLIASTDSVDLVHMLEAALISEYCMHVGCRNKKGTGGEGALNKKPCAPPPYYMYITGGRADNPKLKG